MRLILASSSRYRREMLERLQLPFTAIAPDVDESPMPDESPAQLALRLSMAKAQAVIAKHPGARSEEHTSELQSLMRISYAVFCLKKKKNKTQLHTLNITKNNPKTSTRRSTTKQNTIL